jgi:two-component system, NarL family, response regulator YdfI
MRSILVGTRAERQQLRERLNRIRHDVDVVAEFESLVEARASGMAADAIVLAPPRAAASDEDEPTLLEPMTPREIDVLELVAHGLSNKGIAERLGISDQTVKFHLASIAGKLGAANRTDAVRRAVRRGLITL